MTFDALLQLPPGGHEHRLDGQPVLYVAYQKPLIDRTGGATVIPRTFEDAFVFGNKEIVPGLGEGQTTRKIKALVEQYREQPDVLAEELFAVLKKAKKAEFALDILMHEPPEAVVPPSYVADALSWLDKELTKGVPSTTAVASAVRREDAAA